MKDISSLKTALRRHFQEPEASCLAELFELGLVVDCLSYESINLPSDQKHDCILIAYEERMLIPAKSGISPAWEDRILALCPGEFYFIPPVVQHYLHGARESAEFDPEAALKRTLIEHTTDAVPDLVRFFMRLRHHAPSYTAEAGLMEVIMRELELAFDLHDVIDLFVITGLISPCTRTPMSAGLSWYEINPCLYWNAKPDSRFFARPSP